MLRLTRIAQHLGFAATLFGSLWLAAACDSTDNTDDGGGLGDSCQVNGQSCPVACDLNLGCVDCITDGDCGAADPRCVAGKCEECASTSDCGAGQACFPHNHNCETACSDSGDCNGNDRPICDPLSTACVGCLDHNDCGGGEPLCSSTTGECSECLTNADCGAAQPFCDNENGRCRECLTDGNCGVGEFCDGHDCREGCNINADCGDDGRPICNLDRNNCVECTDNDHCGLAEPICADNHHCVVCVTNNNCTNPDFPYCDDGDACVECTTNDHCDPGFDCDNEECVAAG